VNYVKNAWYIAAWGDAIAPGKMLARTLLDVPVLLWRAMDGTLAALHDRCPHRFAPLSLGKLTEGGVQCGYHGLSFDGLGHCVGNPHGPLAAALRVRSFTVHEKHHAIWIWMGEARADLSTLPDLAFIDVAPATAFSKGYLHSRGNYQFYTDNIMDLSHADYLHPNSIGGGAMTRTKARVEEDEQGVSITWLATNESLGPMMDAVLNLNGAPADIWTEVHWRLPGVMRLVHGGVAAGRPRYEGVNNINLHAVTPETPTTTHYFFAATRTINLHDAAFNEQFANTRQRIFATEDKPMIEAQHDRMGGREFWDLQPILFGIDHGVVRVRRKLEKQIVHETNQGATECPSPAIATNK
jgi:phenylpropionate dioxygenase-like ring-hydroxylating dioxygenase large terminal subunit